MGLNGDEFFPYKGVERPEGKVVGVNRLANGTTDVDIRFRNGTTRKVNSLTIEPHDVWEFTDKGFKGVLQRQAGDNMREQPAHNKVREQLAVEPISRGINGDAMSEVKSLRNELEAFQKAVVQGFRASAGDLQEVANLVKTRVGTDQSYRGTKFTDELVQAYDNRVGDIDDNASEVSFF